MQPLLHENFWTKANVQISEVSLIPECTSYEGVLLHMYMVHKLFMYIGIPSRPMLVVRVLHNNVGLIPGTNVAYLSSPPVLKVLSSLVYSKMVQAHQNLLISELCTASFKRAVNPQTRH